MIDPFDLALSDFIDNLPEDQVSVRRLLDEAAPFGGQGDLPELAELATMLRAVPAYEARPGWMAASKARLMAAQPLPPEKRGLTWLGTMFLPLTQLTFPSLPRLSMPSPVFARAMVAMALIVTIGSMAASGSMVRSPLLQVTGDQGPVSHAQQAISALEQQIAGLSGSDSAPRDIVLLSQQLDLADDAIDQAPPAEQPRLRAQLQSTVRAVRFDGLLEGITNGTTLQIDGVAVQADPAIVQKLHVGQHVSLQVTVGSNGKLQATQVTPATVPAPLVATDEPGKQSKADAPGAIGGNPASVTKTSVTNPAAPATTSATVNNSSVTTPSASSDTETAKTDGDQQKDKGKSSDTDTKPKTFGALTNVVPVTNTSSSADTSASKDAGKSSAGVVATGSSATTGNTSQASTNDKGSAQASSNEKGPASFDKGPGNQSSPSAGANGVLTSNSSGPRPPASSNSDTSQGKSSNQPSGHTVAPSGSISQTSSNSGNQASPGKSNGNGASSTGTGKADNGNGKGDFGNSSAKSDGAAKKK